MFSPIQALRRLAWPSYECKGCVGQEPHHGCYCAYYEAPRPIDEGDDPPLQRRARAALRWALAVTGADLRAWAKHDQTLVVWAGRSWRGDGWGFSVRFQRCGTLRRGDGEEAPAAWGWAAFLPMVEIVNGRWLSGWRFLVHGDAAEIVARRAALAGLKPSQLE